jgi:hypothetical protein
MKNDSSGKPVDETQEGVTNAFAGEGVASSAGMLPRSEARCGLVGSLARQNQRKKLTAEEQ